MLKKLRQDNIIELRESFRRKGKLHLVFEYFEKNLLETLQARSSGLPPELVRFFMYQLVSAIHYCHENNVIHRGKCTLLPEIRASFFHLLFILL